MHRDLWAAWYTGEIERRFAARFFTFRRLAPDPDPGERVDPRTLTPIRFRALLVNVLHGLDEQGLLADAITPAVVEALVAAHSELRQNGWAKVDGVALSRALTAVDSPLWGREPPSAPSMITMVLYPRDMPGIHPVHVPRLHPILSPR